MLRELEKMLEKNSNEFLEIDFTDAAAKLRAKQFIFRDKHGQARTYDILLSHKNYFEELFNAFGDDFFIDQHFGYCGILPRSPRPMLKRLETIFLLTLAKMHDLVCRKARSENGRTQPSESILLDEYCRSTGREKPKHIETKAALERLAKVGVIDLGEVNDLTEMRRITILPSIMKVVSSNYLDCLTTFCDKDETEDKEGTGYANDENKRIKAKTPSLGEEQ